MEVPIQSDFINCKSIKKKSILISADILNYCSRDLVEFLILYFLMSQIDISSNSKQKNNDNIYISSFMQFENKDTFSEPRHDKLEEKNI